MKKSNFILLFISFLWCFQYSSKAQSDEDLQVKKELLNFTASLGSEDREVIFHLNRSASDLSLNDSDYVWTFGDNTTGTGTNPIHNYDFSGTYTVTLKITGEDLITKTDVFTVTETGLRIKYVEDGNIDWPNGDATTMLSPFTHRLKNAYAFDYHRGFDITGEIGDPVRSIADGYIEHQISKDDVPVSGTGSKIKILYIKHVMDTPMYIHGQIISYYYSSHRHLNSIDVSIGDVVSKGDVVGTLGVSGLGAVTSNTKPHNHFEIHVGTRRLQNYLYDLGRGRNNLGRYHDILPLGNTLNEFYEPAAGEPDIDARVNPYLFLNKNANEDSSLRYTLKEKENDLIITVRSDFGEDLFNEIEVSYNGGDTYEKINLSTREGVPDTELYTVNENYDLNVNDNVEITPIRFHDRDLTGEQFDYKITFRFKNYQNFNSAIDYIKVKDIYGNLGVKTDYEPGIVINEVNFESDDIDYNGDESTTTNNDDFIEIVNNSEKDINLDGYRIYDHSTFTGIDELGITASERNNDERYKIENTVLTPGQILLIFNEISEETIDQITDNNSSVIVRSGLSPNKLNIGQTNLERVILTGRYYGVIDIASNEYFWETDEDATYSLMRVPALTGDFVRIDNGSPGEVLSVSENSLSDNALYPNPVNNLLRVVDNNYESYQIYNYLGKQIKSGNIQGNTIDVTSLANSIYLIRVIKYDGTNVIQRIIKI